MQLLLIENEHNAAGWLADRLPGTGFTAVRARSLDHALCDGAEINVSAVVVDLGSYARHGYDSVRALRDSGIDQPLMILSSQSDWRDRVECLDAGADDYLVKPVRAEEVTARLRAIIRRFAGRASNRLVSGDIEIDLKAKWATLAGQPLDLTRNELRLLRLFLMRPDAIMSHQQLAEMLYEDAQERSLNTIEVQIARLRRKIGKQRIRTIRSIGYRFAADQRDDAPLIVAGEDRSASQSPVIHEYVLA